MKAIGIDIGTTTICGIVIDTDTGEVLDVRTLSNQSQIAGVSFEKLQDPDIIMESVWQVYYEFLNAHNEICCIGLTGQMHGILYTDDKGQAVSPLYTWQDERGNEVDSEEVSYAEKLHRDTGYPMSTGFGLTTHYYMVKNKLLPSEAVTFATIADYVGMQLTGRTRPVLTPSMAASLGCFDLELLQFDLDALQGMKLEMDVLPECQNGCVLLGTTKEGIPVAAAIGDNQASVIGSVKVPSESVLINVGTGSQVSTGVEHYIELKHVELRPLVNNEYIMAGSSLCGGRAYATLEQFFRQTVSAMTGLETESLYSRMAELLEKCKGEPQTLQANTRFCGTRENPSVTGDLNGLTLNNFTPQQLIRSVLYGIAEELKSFHEQMLVQGANKPHYLIGSGNGIRQNRHLQNIFEEMFQLPMLITVHREEASYGAALYAMTAAGVTETLVQAQSIIRYR